jgi:hypothetical protein
LKTVAPAFARLGALPNLDFIVKPASLTPLTENESAIRSVISDFSSDLAFRAEKERADIKAESGLMCEVFLFLLKFQTCYYDRCD